VRADFSSILGELEFPLDQIRKDICLKSLSRVALKYFSVGNDILHSRRKRGRLRLVIRWFEVIESELCQIDSLSRIKNTEQFCGDDSSIKRRRCRRCKTHSFRYFVDGQRLQPIRFNLADEI